MDCSIIIPAYRHLELTRRCLAALLPTLPADRSCEVLVVDDGSPEDLAALLAPGFAWARVLTLLANKGFAAACNAGAAAAQGARLVFLNNDTLPKAGWLSALLEYAEANPAAAAAGARLLFPDETIQHAGVVFCQDGYPRHIYAGFPADHPSVARSRRFQAVTAACMLVRRETFLAVGGFDDAYRNGFEDVDLCLRLGEAGHEVHYCHESVLYHLESVSPGRFDADRENVRRYQRRWLPRVRRDDLDYYLADGLLRLGYERYPLRLEVSPLLATIDDEARERAADRLLDARARQVGELLRETIRLTLRVQELEA